MIQLSTVIPCFNHGLYLEEAVDSTLSQTGTDMTVVVVDDGSTDEYTKLVLQAVKKLAGVRVIHQKSSRAWFCEKYRNFERCG